jgi:D-glycero-D-manno-heptose 1,7-bisphosphate phosphatase
VIRAVFLDRDGTITYGVPRYERVDSIDKVELLPNTLKALEILAKLEFSVFIITNQAGLAEGFINNKVLELVAPSGIHIIKTYVCPHSENDNCDCRKPKPKLLFDAAYEYDINLKESYMIGDRQSDVMAGVNAGTKTILVKTGNVSEDFDQASHNSPSLLEAIEYIASS